MIYVYQVISDTNVGGAGRYLLNYVRHFNRREYNVTVLIPENSKLRPLLGMFADIRIIEVPFMADKSYDKRCVKFLHELFLKEKPDIVHTHASLSARIAAKKAKVKTVVATRHCIEGKGRFPISSIKRYFNNLLCDYYIAVSGAVKRNLRDCGIQEEKIREISNGVDAVKELPEEEKKRIRETYGIGNETVFGIFARLEPVKGHKYFIEAARKFLKEGYEGKFFVVGDGSLKRELMEQAKDVPEIIFTGYVKDTTELLNITDVNVLASESEAMSLAILEAMSLGKPTIATDVGGNGQLITNGVNGVLTHYKDSDGMKKAFVKFATDRTFYEENAKNAKSIYMQAYTAETMVQNLERFYEEVTNGNK